MLGKIGMPLEIWCHVLCLLLFNPVAVFWFWPGAGLLAAWFAAYALAVGVALSFAGAVCGNVACFDTRAAMSRAATSGNHVLCTTDCVERRMLVGADLQLAFYCLDVGCGRIPIDPSLGEDAFEGGRSVSCPYLLATAPQLCLWRSGVLLRRAHIMVYRHTLRGIL